MNLSARGVEETNGSLIEGSGMARYGNVSGEVFDKQTGKAVEYANVVVFSKRDGSMISGTITDSNGSFMMDKLPFGMYKITLDFIGYDKITIDSVRIYPSNRKINLGRQILSQSMVMLQGVEVVADKIAYDYKIDKKVVNVSQDVTSAGGTAADVLENTPSVDVDIEGNVTMRGSSSFTVLVNGRPSVLEGSDALQQLPASNIENIEIITNPSAKYDPDGTAGIINVILKKEIDQGFGGIVNLSAGMNDKYRSNVLLNYRINKWSFTGGIDYRDDNFKMERSSERETYFDDLSTEFINSFGERNMNIKSVSGRFGIDYSLSDKTIIGISTKFGSFEFGMGGLNKTHKFYNPPGINVYYNSLGEMSRLSDYYDINFNVQHKFDDKGQKLDFLFYYSNRDGEGDNSTLETETDALWNETSRLLNSNRSVEFSENKSYRIQLDYVKPLLANGKFELGYQARLSDAYEEYAFESFDGAIWVNDPLYSSTSDFTRNIHSGYAIFNNETLSGFGYQLGLRSEYTKRETGIEGVTGLYSIDRFDLFPSIHFSKKLKQKNQLMLSYSRRINRPSGRELDPFLSYRDENNRFQGNPALEPEYIDSFELGWQKKWRKRFLTIEAYYKITSNLISRVLQNTDEGYVLHTSANLDNDYSLGTEAMINQEFSKKLSMNLSGTVYYYKIKGSLESAVVDRSSTNWSTSLNSTYKFAAASRLQLRLGYRGATTTAQGIRKGFLTSSLALRHDFWRKKASLTLQVRDLFKTMKRDMIIEGDHIWEHVEMQRESQILQLSLSFKINNYKQKREKRSGSEMDMSDMEF
jgi:outer membrane receptor protein involved in Fe transport